MSAAPGKSQDSEATSANSGMSAGDASKPEGKAIPPHCFNVQQRLSPSDHVIAFDSESTSAEKRQRLVAFLNIIEVIFFSKKMDSVLEQYR